MAMTKPPFLNGSSSSVRERVPSGKIRNVLPDWMERTASAIEAIAFSRFSRCDRDEAARHEHPAEQRQLQQLRLEEYVQPPVKGHEQDGRIDVALMIGDEDDGPIAWNLFEPSHLAFDAGEEDAEPRSEAPGGVEHARPLEQHRHEQPGWREDQNVEGNGQKGHRRADGGDCGCHGLILARNTKARVTVTSARASRAYASVVERLRRAHGASRRRGVRAGHPATGALLAFVRAAAARSAAGLGREAALERLIDPSFNDRRLSRMTSETSVTMSPRARSSMRFSRNERLFERARKVRLFSTSAMSKIEPLRILSELSLNRPFQF